MTKIVIYITHLNKSGYAGFTKTERQRGKLYDIEHYQQTNGYHSRNPQSRRRPSHQTGKWQTQLINPHIVLSKEPQGFVADATITTPNGPLVASAKHDDMYTAVNELIAKLERQLNKVQHKGEARRCNASVKDIVPEVTQEQE